ncbi:MAG: sulfatase [Actinomycetota bacterium]|nr:sulfatase [Actinomycetota bacterium]
MRKTVLLAASMAAALLLACAGVLVVLEEPGASAQTSPKPNIVFVLTDDQDARSLQHMPTVQRELVRKGTTFENGILPLPMCCPSRASMLRGQHTHNHGIISGTLGARAFRDRGLERSTVATWLDEAGYRTGLVGKYVNGYEYRYVPPGWDRWYANMAKDAWADCLNENGEEKCHGGKHPDAVLADKAEQFVRSSKGDPNPLFLWLAFNAPHEENGGPPPYMRQDRNKFSRTALPKLPSFDEADVSDKPKWVRSMPRISPKGERRFRALHRDRLRSLQTVDRAVGRLTDALADAGRLENTYIVFFTDNGYHMGEHRLPAGKTTPYLEDVRFPLVVRGPDVPQGQVRQELVLNIDLAPTFAELGGAPAADFVDGRSLAPLLGGGTTPWRTAALLENRKSPKLHRPAYAGLFTGRRTYVEYENGERELYDVEADPYQLENIYRDADPALKASLEAQVDKLRVCRSEGCRTAEDAPNP